MEITETGPTSIEQLVQNAQASIDHELKNYELILEISEKGKGKYKFVLTGGPINFSAIIDDVEDRDILEIEVTTGIERLNEKGYKITYKPQIHH